MDSIVLMMKTLHHNINRQMERIGKKLGITGVQFMVLNFILENEEKDIFKKDIENLIGVRGATVTGIVQNLVQKGYVERVVSNVDARKKKIVLCEDKKQDIVFLKNEMARLKDKIESGITDKEREEFSRIINKLKENLKDEKILKEE